MVAYKTTDTSITSTMPSLDNIPAVDKISNDIWVNNESTKKNIYLYIQVKGKYSGVSSDRFSCAKISDDAAYANKDTFTTPAGNTHKGVRLYTEYVTDCGYYYE